jgi:hypothetical protein
MISSSELRAYLNSGHVGRSASIGVAVVAIFLAYALTVEPPRAAQIQLVFTYSALLLATAAITANVVGYAIWHAQALPEGPKRIAYIVMAVTAISALIYFYVEERAYRFDDYIVIAFYAWIAWVVFLLLALAAAALVRWVGDGFRQG